MWVEKIAEVAGMVISFIGIIIIVVVSIRALYNFYKFLRGYSVQINDIRVELGYGIILGLEFFVAADIIESVLRPTYYDLGILASIVVIRTFLSYFLNKELQELHDEQLHHQLK